MKQKEEGVAWLRTQNFYSRMKDTLIGIGLSEPLDAYLSLWWMDTARLSAALRLSGFSDCDVQRWIALYCNFLIS